MYYTLATAKKPKKNFNLLHMEASEIYLMSLKVALNIDTHNEE